MLVDSLASKFLRLGHQQGCVSVQPIHVCSRAHGHERYHPVDEVPFLCFCVAPITAPENKKTYTPTHTG